MSNLNTCTLGKIHSYTDFFFRTKKTECLLIVHCLSFVKIGKRVHIHLLFHKCMKFLGEDFTGTLIIFLRKGPRRWCVRYRKCALLHISPSPPKLRSKLKWKSFLLKLTFGVCFKKCSRQSSTRYFKKKNQLQSRLLSRKKPR